MSIAVEVFKLTLNYQVLVYLLNLCDPVTSEIQLFKIVSGEIRLFVPPA